MSNSSPGLPADPLTIPPTSPQPNPTERRLRCYPPVPSEDLRPLRPEPGDAEIVAAMRTVARSLTDSRFGGPLPHLPAAPGELYLNHSACLAFLQECGHGRAAAEWAIYRLVNSGRLYVVWPEVNRLVPLTAEYAIAQAERYRCRPATVTDWDLFEYGRVYQIRSTPALWEWLRSGCPIENPIPSPASAVETKEPAPRSVPSAPDNSAAPNGTTQGDRGALRPNPDRPKRRPDQPSQDRQRDILATINEKGIPLTRPELIAAMRLSTEGKLGAHLAWMVKANILTNIPQKGYWPFGRPVPA